MSLTNDLNCRVKVYARQPFLSEYGDTDFKDTLLCEIWAQILPHGGLGRATGGKMVSLPAGMQESKLQHSVIVRAGTIPAISTDLYITYKGARYNVDFIRPYYKSRDRLEMVCTMEEIFSG